MAERRRRPEGGVEGVNGIGVDSDSTESSNRVDQIKDRYDMREAIKMMSPFEK